MRVELFGDEVEAISRFDPLTGEVRRASSTSSSSSRPRTTSPATNAAHAPSPRSRRSSASACAELRGRGQAARGPAAADAHRARPGDARARSASARASRTTRATSTAASRASRPTRCSTTSPTDFLLVIDESHVAVPQIRGQYAGDRSRKEILVEHGFRLPRRWTTGRSTSTSSMARMNQCVFVSATPGPYELEVSDAGRRADRSARPAWSTPRSW